MPGPGKLLVSWVWPHLGLRDRGCRRRAPCLGSLLPGDVPGADRRGLVWKAAGVCRPEVLVPSSHSRAGQRCGSPPAPSLARALCSSNNLIRFPRPPIEMRLTSACTRACGPSEAIPDPDPGSRGAGTCPGSPHTPFFSQDSPRRVAEKGPPREDAAWNHRAEGFSRMRSFQKLQAGQLRPRNCVGLPPALRRIPTTRAVPSYTSHPPRYCKLFPELLHAQEWLGEGRERGGPPPDRTAGERREG